MAKNELWNDLKWRGLIYDATPGLNKQIDKGVTLYLGIDPTGNSLHIGHLVGLSVLRRFWKAGHEVIVIMGGGTSMIGDPSGKDEERPIISREEIEKNKNTLKKQIENYLDFGDDRVQMVDNVEWLGEVKMIDFLREVGKHMPVSSMMGKESVKARLEREQGLSYAEFSYQLLQAYDFFELYERYDCNLQVGGSDQWGNILQGVDLIRRKVGKKVHGLSFPLIVDPSTGRKFGKTAEGSSIWLDEEKTHPFDLYQFMVNVSDELAPQLMKFYSFREREEIEKIISEWKEDKSKRGLQKELAFELVKIVHGEKNAKQARKISEILFEKGEEEFEAEDFDFIRKSIPSFSVESKEQIDLVEILSQMELVDSKSKARRLVKQKGVEICWFFDQFGLVKKGKKDFGLIIVEKS